MAYSDPADLLLGDLILPVGLDKQKVVDAAADEMDAKLGFVYVTPIDLDGNENSVPIVEPLPRHQALLLKGINNKLASGRLILSMDAAGEQTTLHAYGLSLVREANAELLAIANGDVDLDAPRIEAIGTAAVDRSPGVVNEDSESLLLGFVNTVHKGQAWQTQPGEFVGSYGERRRAAGG